MHTDKNASVFLRAPTVAIILLQSFPAIPRLPSWQLGSIYTIACNAAMNSAHPGTPRNILIIWEHPQRQSVASFARRFFRPPALPSPRACHRGSWLCSVRSCVSWKRLRTFVARVSNPGVGSKTSAIHGLEIRVTANLRFCNRCHGNTGACLPLDRSADNNKFAHSL